MSTPCSTTTAPDPYQRLGDEELVPALHALAAPIFASARALGPVPSPRTAAFLAAPPHVQLAALVTAGMHLVLFGNPVAAVHHEVSHDIHGGDTAHWRRIASNHLPFEELQRRRAVVGPMSRQGESAA